MVNAAIPGVTLVVASSALFHLHHSINSDKKLDLAELMSKKDQIWTCISLEISIRLLLCPKFKQHWDWDEPTLDPWLPSSKTEPTSGHGPVESSDLGLYSSEYSSSSLMSGGHRHVHDVFEALLPNQKPCRKSRGSSMETFKTSVTTPAWSSCFIAR